MDKMEVHPIGRIEEDENGMRIVLDQAYGPALRGLEGFSHVQVIWWFDLSEDTGSLMERRPYVKGPDELGVFATRSPMRPNPIAVSSVDIAYVDETAATVGLHYIDAYPGSPVLDLKPYTPSVDRVEDPSVPMWCAHWPRSYEESAGFDWEAEFNFKGWPCKSGGQLSWAALPARSAPVRLPQGRRLLPSNKLACSYILPVYRLFTGIMAVNKR